jgi:hypothetical protein
VNFTQAISDHPSGGRRLAIAALLLAGLGLSGAWREPRSRSLALLWAAVPPLLALGMSVKRPLYMDRFCSYRSRFSSSSAGRQPPARRDHARAAALVALTGLAMIRFCLWPARREQWREAAELEQLIPASDRRSCLADRRPAELLLPRLNALSAMDQSPGGPSELASGHEGVWVVYWNAAADIHRVASDPPFRPEEESDAEAASWLAGQGPPLLERVDYVGVTLLHFGASR